MTLPPRFKATSRPRLPTPLPPPSPGSALQHITGADAMWAGIPILTTPLSKWTSRVAASALLASGAYAIEVISGR